MSLYVPSREPHRVTPDQVLGVVDLTIVVCGRRNVGMLCGEVCLEGEPLPHIVSLLLFGVSGPWVRSPGRWDFVTGLRQMVIHI